MAPRLLTLAELGDSILQQQRAHPVTRALTVGITGIDGAGKGWVADRLAAGLRTQGAHVALLHVDDWLNLPHVRFSPHDPARHFYTHAVRLAAFRDQLLAPLAATRAVDLLADLAEETATAFRRHRYHFCDVDILLAEGIFLLKPALREHFDLTVWVDCPFDVALQRALARAQEGLPPDETRAAYETIYFPAQQYHFAIDHPQDAATFVLPNGEAVG